MRDYLRFIYTDRRHRRSVIIGTLIPVFIMIRVLTSDFDHQWQKVAAAIFMGGVIFAVWYRVWLIWRRVR